MDYKDTNAKWQRDGEEPTGRKVIINLIIVVCKSLLMLQFQDKSDLFFGICWKRKV